MEFFRLWYVLLCGGGGGGGGLRLLPRFLMRRGEASGVGGAVVVSHACSRASAAVARFEGSVCSSLDRKSRDFGERALAHLGYLRERRRRREGERRRTQQQQQQQQQRLRT